MAIWGVGALTQLAYLLAFLALDPTSIVVARVNGKAITKADLNFFAWQQNVPPEKRSEVDPKLIEQLIDRQLVRAFLTLKKVEPDANELRHLISNAEELIRKNGQDPDKFLANLGYTPARLKNELGLTLAWYAYANRTIKPEQVKRYFEQHKEELDGTQLRASQIFLKLPEGSPEKELAAEKKKELAERKEKEIAEKKKQLLAIRSDILAQKLTFAEAAQRYSEAPSAKEGGDMGLFSWQGKITPTVSQAAFALKTNEMSEPIVSPHGVHLVLVTARHPGQFSLEDVRVLIMKRLTEQLWTETIAKERQTAKIERPEK